MELLELIPLGSEQAGRRRSRLGMDEGHDWLTIALS